MVKTKTITKGWPPKRKREYAARIRKTRIWLHSTGPAPMRANKFPAAMRLAMAVIVRNGKLYVPPSVRTVSFCAR